MYNFTLHISPNGVMYTITAIVERIGSAPPAQISLHEEALQVVRAVSCERRRNEVGVLVPMTGQSPPGNRAVEGHYRLPQRAVVHKKRSISFGENEDLQQGCTRYTLLDPKLTLKYDSGLGYYR